MSAMYSMTYAGVAGLGAGTVYIGRGVVLGADVGGGRYHGTCADQDDCLALNVTLSFPEGGQLITGLNMAPGSSLQLQATWPQSFADGQPQPIMVGAHLVEVVFQKIGDVP
jgi:hypothetical protein